MLCLAWSVLGCVAGRAQVMAPLIDQHDPIIFAARAGNLAEVSRLVDTGTPINSCDAFGNTALSEALKSGHADVAREVMRRGFNPILNFHSAVAQVYLEIGRVPLTLAVKAGDDDIVDGLLDRGLAVYTEFNTDRYSDAGDPVVAAIRANRIEVVKKLIAGVSPALLRHRLGENSYQYLEPCSSVEIIDLLASKGIDVNDPSGTGPFPTALHAYAKRGWVEGIKELIVLGANPLKVDMKGVLPEDVAATPEVKRLLITAAMDQHMAPPPDAAAAIPGAEPAAASAPNLERRRHFPREVVVTAQSGSEDAAIALADAASQEDIDTPDDRGWTLLNYAFKYRYLKLAARLLDRGTDVIHLTRGGSSVAAFAASTNDVGLVQRVVKMGAPVDGSAHGNPTALTNAVLDKNEPMVAVLLALGAKPVRAGMGGHASPVESSLMVAAERGDIPMMRDLLGAGADINEFTMWDESAVFYAVLSHNTDAVTWLVQKGADLHHLTSRNTNVLTLAADDGNLPMVKFLVGLGITHPDAASYAQQAAHMEVADYLRSLPSAAHGVDAAELWNRSTVTTDDVRKYIADGGDVNYSHNCPTPLQRMAIIGDAEAISMLLDHGAEPDKEGNYVGPPASLAMMSENGSNSDENVLVLLRLFIEHGVLIESPYKHRNPFTGADEIHNCSYLLQALDDGFLKCAKYLLDKGANPWFRDSNTHQNAFDCLKYSLKVSDEQRYQFAAVLREYGRKTEPPESAPKKAPNF
jgi:ankyrin repeat protein